MKKRFLAISLLLTLTLAFLPLSIFPVRADSVFYTWGISNATNGENTNCQNWFDNLGSNAIDHSGIRATDNSWDGKILSSMTFYIMRLSGSSGSGTVTIASFRSSDGGLIASLGTIPYASLPVCVSSAPVSTTLSGLSYTIPSGAYVGFLYSGLAADNVVDYFDYNAGSVSLPAVTHYYFAASPPGVLQSFAHEPFFGSMSETPAAPPSHSALYTIWAPIVAITVIGMALFGLVKSKGTPLIVLVISLAVILGFVSVIMGVWS